MQLIQEGFFCEYEMNVFMKLYFDKDEDVVVNTLFSYENNKIKATTKIEYNKKTYEESLQYDYEKTNPRKDKIVFRCFVVRSFIKAAENIKHVSIPWGALSGIRPAKVVRQMKESGMEISEIYKELDEIFGVKKEKADLSIEVCNKEIEILKNIKENSVSLYIGIPFCPSKCLYCSFVSNDLRTGKKYLDEYTYLLCKEIEKAGEVIKRLGFSLENIYIGGGTPTSVEERHLKEIFNSIKNNLDISDIKEFTLEAGRADTITKEKLLIAKEAGVNRLSINPQTMNDETLLRVGRKHTSEDVKEKFNLARSLGFDNINMDLIAGLPGEDFKIFKNSLDEIIKLDPENITIHSLCIKRAAAFRLSEYSLTDSAEMNKMLDYAQKEMKNTNRFPYYMYRQKNISGNLENVGYAKEGTHSFYNINIMEEVQNIIAVGGGGTSKVVKGDRIERIFNFKDASEYIKRFKEIIDKKEEFYNIYKKM